MSVPEERSVSRVCPTRLVYSCSQRWAFGLLLSLGSWDGYCARRSADMFRVSREIAGCTPARSQDWSVFHFRGNTQTAIPAAGAPGAPRAPPACEGSHGPTCWPTSITTGPLTATLRVWRASCCGRHPRSGEDRSSWLACACSLRSASCKGSGHVFVHLKLGASLAAPGFGGSLCALPSALSLLRVAGTFPSLGLDLLFSNWVLKE